MSSVICGSTRSSSVAVEDSEASSASEVLHDCQVHGHQLLYLNYKGLTKFPAQLLQENAYQHIKGIYLKRNLLQTLPTNLKTLTNLKELYLPSNKIIDLPDDMSELTQLESLDLSMNSLQHIPSCVFGIKSLKSLILSQNSIAHLSSEIGKMRALMTLVLNHNLLTSLPSEIQHCSSLETLNLDKNFLKVLPRQITLLHRLEELSVTGNKLVYLPMDLGYCPSLQKVYADNNPYLKAIPFSLWSKTVGTYSCGTETICDSGLYAEFKEANMSAYIPHEIQSIRSKNSSPVSTLLEISYRYVNKQQGILKIESLPRSVREQAVTATAHCEFHGCSRQLFTGCYPHLLKHPITTLQQPNSTTFIGLCCSLKCLDLFSRFPLPL
ncbi:leucine-rich repeat-containing protein 28-like isoform X2 [Anneissia japonica]|nr:leucine-rich repeat-containing protein 28-like isoform X2 [Anneissia japonica]XP_033115282.1 leucine-rich repeat-containing protein 28-like isoform X2 [Anneissia japonica]XP_033115283.1 leucine-rich repeat-containing protein 28-like isoform X2 [Anneissia japonica]